MKDEPRKAHKINNGLFEIWRGTRGDPAKPPSPFFMRPTGDVHAKKSTTSPNGISRLASYRGLPGTVGHQ